MGRGRRWPNARSELCDIADFWDGASAVCPADEFAAAATDCVSGYCDGLGTCFECTENSHCDDGLACTVDSCASGVCSADSSACSTPVTLTAGSEHACVLLADGSVWCWGDNAVGQLGAPISTYELATPIASLPEIRQVAAGSYHTCALDTSGQVHCWGRNQVGQLGDGSVVDRSTPEIVPGIAGAMSVAAAGEFTCAVVGSAEQLFCWGANREGQLGIAPSFFSTRPLEVSGVAGVQQVALGTEHACALGSDGLVRCWGRNNFSQLGAGPPTPNHVAAEPVSGLANVNSIAAGGAHTCAQLSGGELRCWGSNTSGALGDGTADPTETPVRALQQDALQAAVGNGFACARLTDSVSCWGRGTSGQLGPGVTSSLTPVPIATPAPPTWIAAGDAFACVIANGGVHCWGQDRGGQIGDGSIDGVTTVPRQAALPTAVGSLASGHEHSCAIDGAGMLWCWGDNFFGQVGTGDKIDVPTPIVVTGIANVAEVSTGSGHTCARQTDGEVFCWGHNRFNAIGDGTTTDAVLPTQVFSGATGIAAGNTFSCARTGGTLDCWGQHPAGTDSTPTAVADVTGIDEFGVGAFHACATLSSGSLVCWGNNGSGQLGDGTMTNSTTPVTVPGITDVVDIAGGRVHTCVLHDAGQVSCWGDNVFGQLGTATNDNNPVPATIAGLSDITALTDGNGDHTCALNSMGEVFCWGYNEYHQVRADTNAIQPSPRRVPLDESVTSISTGFGFSCMLTEAGGVHCWGLNAGVQLGLGPGYAPSQVIGLP